MKYVLPTILISWTALLSGCATSGDSYCDLAGPIYFEDEASLLWLMEHDRRLVEDIVVNNETYSSLCN